MQRRDRRGRRSRPGHAAASHRRARRAGAACARPRLRRAVLRRRALSRGADRGALWRSCPRRLRRRGRFRRHRRLRAEGLRALRQDPADQGRPLACRQSDGGAALPHECRHHRRGRHAEGAPRALARHGEGPHRADRARRSHARRGRGVFHRDAAAGRHLRIRRRDFEIRGAGRERGLCLALHLGRSQGAGLRRRQVSAFDLSGRPRAPDAGRSEAMAATAGAGARMAAYPAMAVDGAGAKRPAGRDLSARRQILSRLLSVRGPARAPDAWACC